MKIVWDEPKREINIEVHEGLDFAIVTEAFFDDAIVFPAKKGRMIAIGRIKGGLRGHLPAARDRGCLDHQPAPGQCEGKEGARMNKQRRHAKEDWEAVSDFPELTDEQIAQGRPFAQVHPDLAATIRRRGPGRRPRKEVVTLRLDPDVLAAFKADGEGWQSRINDALRKAKKLPASAA